ncbi:MULTISPECIES: Lrp/AsnC ligand binding domain-containing protein [Sphingopyxis]|jgi:Lrp/AsnC family leucine-responsive transcriptional regulator|uniref:Lrp/AsnC ligand binding domain-containing protein n=1 Tax=Sphingopyxis TaxID=165697 RepID=UPI00082F69A9|nr:MULTISPECIES: Lrp/AsnC ligand binding domain-containing protein [Sphingopyxis]APW73566.1 ArsR family transcriptional regulator [Sphingopyxis granuli]AVA14611.1 ArsR family transcriptional regulator [Sphingopyxis sp. MG]ODU27969.1 MAG: ArsR family transcriptional regulator [Sphingopyxis sp. SCN 67-31]QUM73473.1 Lrp/AsnC ligand binding domain-containing protein [Sphingopyxis granuli]
MLNDADRRILKVIQAEGRITNQELANRCGLSPSACFDRLKRLREQGYILGFHALLNPTKLDRALLIFIEVLMDRTTGDVFQEFAASVSVMPEILECHMVAGGFDYLIKVRVRDMEAYRAFLADTLVHMPGVRETRTYAVLEEVKNSASLPL